MKHVLCTLFLMSFGAPLQAAPVILDFEEPILDFGPLNQTLSTQGFELAVTTAGSFVTGGEPTLQLAWGGDGGFMLTAESGASFNLASADIGAWIGGTNMSVVGQYAGGGNVQLDFSTGDNYSVASIIFGSSWVGLQSVEFISLNSPGIIDNILVDVVPIPAAVWLFGSALFGLGWLRSEGK